MCLHAILKKKGCANSALEIQVKPLDMGSAKGETQETAQSVSNNPAANRCQHIRRIVVEQSAL